MAAPAIRKPNASDASDSELQARASAPDNIHTAYLGDSAEIAAAFKVLRDQRAPVHLNFEGDNTTYIARVLDLGGDEFLLEDIHPRNGLQKMRPGQEFALSSRIQGIYVHSGSNRVLAVEAERGIPFFRIRLPATLLYQQRRRAARFRLPRRVAAAGARIEVFRQQAVRDKEGGRLSGRIVDISAGGCRADLDSPVAVAIEHGEQVHCRVDIPDMLAFEALATIRHSSYNVRKRTINCGIELMEMQVTDRRRLEQFIESIRRSAERR